jgi:cyanophycin synthetase
VKIVELHFYQGRNIYSHRPVMRMLLDLAQWRTFRTDRHPEFGRELLRHLPGLAEHHCSRRRQGGFLERLHDGTYLGHVTEHVFLELQEQAGIGTEYGKTLTVKGGLVEVVSEYRCRSAAEVLARAAVSVVSAILTGNSFSVSETVAEARCLAARHMPGPSTAAILAAARRRGIPVTSLEDGTSLYRLGTGKYQQRIMASLSEKTKCVAVDISCNKQITKKLLSEHGLPVPRGKVVTNVGDALIAASELGFPLAMKPDNGNQGKGVSLKIESELEVKKAFFQATLYSPGVMVEKYLPGRHYRLLVINGELVAASERMPACVLGDGRQTVKQLIDSENDNPLRGEGHELPLTKINIDRITEEVLARNKLALSSIPAQGQLVWLRENANLSTGGTARDVTDEVHPLQAELAIIAAKVVGLDIAGVDVVMGDIAAPPQCQDGGIIEVNAAPGLRMHLHPSEGQPRNVGEKVIDMLFPPGKPYRVPVFSITGTNGKTTTTRMLEFVLRRHGLYTGMTCTDGIYFGNSKAKSGDLTGPAGARAVLAHPEVEVAILETARGGIIRRGLGYDRADVAVITNIREDHLGQDGVETLDDLVHIKSLVAEAVYPGGTAVLNADESYIHDVSARVWSEIIYVSTGNESIIVRRHLGKGGRAVFTRKGTILAAQGNRATVVGRLRDFPVTFGGKAAHQVENLLHAIAACWGFGLFPRQAGQYLRKFASNIEDNPGRTNLFNMGAYRVLVDYGHNPDGIAKTGELARKLHPNKTVAVIGVPGDRSDEAIIKTGEVAGRYFDHLVIKEDEDLRGRKVGETARLLLEGALAAGKDVSSISVYLDERKAIGEALAMACPSNLVVIFYEKLEATLTELVSHHARQMPKDTAGVTENTGNMINPVSLP